MVAHGSALHVHHLSVVVVEFANTNTAQKMHYQVDTDNQSDYRCITV